MQQFNCTYLLTGMKSPSRDAVLECLGLVSLSRKSGKISVSVLNVSVSISVSDLKSKSRSPEKFGRFRSRSRLVSSRTQNQKSRSRLGLGPQRIVGISVYLPIWSYQSTQHVQTTVALYVCIFCTSISNCLIPVWCLHFPLSYTSWFSQHSVSAVSILT